MIRFAAPGDHPRLKALWAEAFGDSQEAVDAYFKLRHRDENMLVDAQDGTVAGMLSMLPVALNTSGGRTFSARYLYAVATGATFRNRGISTALLEAAHAHMASLGEAAGILVPASPALIDFYRKRGYETAFYLDVVTLNADTLPPFPRGGRFGACSAGDYARIRNAAFRNSRLYARWEESAVSYAMRTFAREGGVTMLSWEGGRGCAAWEKTKDGVLVRELALLGGDVNTALSVLHGRLNAKRYTARLAEGTVPGAAPRPFGMIRWLIPEPALDGKPPYLSLAMD